MVGHMYHGSHDLSPIQLSFIRISITRSRISSPLLLGRPFSNCPVNIALIGSSKSQPENVSFCNNNFLRRERRLDISIHRQLPNRGAGPVYFALLSNGVFACLAESWAEKPCYGKPLEEHLVLSGRDIAFPIEACVTMLLECGMQEEVRSKQMHHIRLLPHDKRRGKRSQRNLSARFHT